MALQASSGQTNTITLISFTGKAAIKEKKPRFTTKAQRGWRRNQSRTRYFTAETQSSQSLEYIFIKQPFTPRPPRLRGGLSGKLRNAAHYKGHEGSNNFDF